MKHVLRVKAKAEHVRNDTAVPRNPQFGFIEYIDEFTWKAHDKLTGKEVIILKRSEGKFVYFEISYSKDIKKVK